MFSSCLVRSLQDLAIVSQKWCKELVPQQLADILLGTGSNKEQGSDDEECIQSDSDSQKESSAADEDLV